MSKIKFVNKKIKNGHFPNNFLINWECPHLPILLTAYAR